MSTFNMSTSKALEWLSAKTRKNRNAEEVPPSMNVDIKNLFMLSSGKRLLARATLTTTRRGG